MTHSTAVLFVNLGNWVGNWLLGLASDNEETGKDDARSPAPVRFQAGRERLPPRDESFYWAWQYWSH
ncbi:hypothetical protein [Mesorhizobium comanense]|uniref:hypothetical protein n=1 Tax=Mesorhizobium comanense TaxID=2502215 RepID=UPI0010F8ACAD|nr:hypothetical protein [Mesorhizobium comanense]